jgi:solute carrier family 25 ornithine transporter 2/15
VTILFSITIFISAPSTYSQTSDMETDKKNIREIKNQISGTGEDMADVKVLDYRAMIVDFIAGANAGTACVFAGQPFDTVKVKMQVFPNLYKSAFECFKRTLKEERFRGLYAGTAPALVTQVAENSILFLCYGRCQTVIQSIFQVPHVDELSIFQNACAGSVAAFITSFALCPTELIKCKLQAQHQFRQISGDHGKKPM